MKLIFLLLISWYSINSQTNSDLSLTEHKNVGETILDLFPLHVGNFWQYKVTVDYPSNYEDTVYYVYREILKDTLMLNGFVYKYVYATSDAWPHQDYLRVDSLTGCIYKYDDYSNEEFLIDSLRMITGNSIISGYGFQIECVSVDSIYLFGESRLTKYFSFPLIQARLDYMYAEGIGQIYRLFSYGQIGVTNVISEVTYAKVNGNEFGALVSVNNNYFKELSYLLSQNYPNPFNPSTSIQYLIGSRQFVTLKVYDVLGNEIAILVNEELQAGEYEVEFDGTGLPSGIYFYKLQAGDYNQTKKMILIK